MIYDYELVSPRTDYNAPFLYENGVFCVPAIGKVYTRYVEVKRYENYEYCYYLLLSDKDFDEHCFHCRVDDWGRLKVPLHKETVDYIKNIINSVGNPKFEYIESKENYDVWQIKW